MKYNDNGIWKDLTVKVSDTLPIGTVIPFAGNTVPSDWMVCDGSTLSRTEYALLFAAIGTSFGEGDGETTFNIPDLRGKAPVGLDLEDTDFDTIGETGGEKEHTLTINELPSHSHRQLYASNPTSGSWGRDISGVNYHVISSPVSFYNGIFSDETGGNQSHNIMQPYVVVNYIIKVLDASALGSGLIVDGASTSNTDAYSCNYVNSLNSYTSSEKKIGSWIDGKDLYQKTYTGVVPVATNTQQLFPLDIQYSDIWIDESASFLTRYDKSSETLPANYYFGSSDYCRTWVNKNISDIRIKTGSDLRAYNYVLTIRYTKATN